MLDPSILKTGLQARYRPICSWLLSRHPKPQPARSALPRERVRSLAHTGNNSLTIGRFTRTRRIRAGAKVSDLKSIVKRIESGDKVRVYQDFYGQQWLHLSRGWQIWRRKRIKVHSQDMEEVHAALRRRRKARMM